MPKVPYNPKQSGGRRREAKPLMQSQIEEAQRATKSAAEAARYLGVDYKTYKKYARLYGIHNHLNPTGVGIRKGGWGKLNKALDLQKILNGEYPNYDIRLLKQRLLVHGIFPEECSLCGFDKKREQDQKAPLLLCFKDGSYRNHKKENLFFACYNCCFLIHRFDKWYMPSKMPVHRLQREYLPPAEQTTGGIDLSPEELRQLQREALEELDQS